MLGDGIVIQQVLLAAMDTTCLHLLKLPRPFLMVQLTPPAYRQGLPAGSQRLCDYATIVASLSDRRVLVFEHILGEALNDDSILEAIEHRPQTGLWLTRRGSVLLIAA